MLSQAVKQAIEDQIAALNARSQQLRAKIDSGQELTEKEAIELAALSDRISSLLRELKELDQA